MWFFSVPLFSHFYSEKMEINNKTERAEKIHIQGIAIYVGRVLFSKQTLSTNAKWERIKMRRKKRERAKISTVVHSTDELKSLFMYA